MMPPSLFSVPVFLKQRERVQVCVLTQSKMVLIGLKGSFKIYYWPDLSAVTDINLGFSPDSDQREKKYKAHRQFGDRRGGVISARTYFYADEAKCDNQMETFINCIKASGESREARAVVVLVLWWLSTQKVDWVYFLFSGGASADGFSAIKMTALGRPQFLVSLGVLDICVQTSPLMNCHILTAPVFWSPGEMAAFL